jgi:hypothetical protein
MGRDRLAEARRDVMAKYGRHHRDRRRGLVWCTPSRAEQRRDPQPHSAGKVIFDSEEIARAAVRELRSLGNVGDTVYPCPRSRHGHFHITHARQTPEQRTVELERQARAAQRLAEPARPPQRPPQPPRRTPEQDLDARIRRALGGGRQRRRR